MLKMFGVEDIILLLKLKKVVIMSISGGGLISRGNSDWGLMMKNHSLLRLRSLEENKLRK